MYPRAVCAVSRSCLLRFGGPASVAPPKGVAGPESWSEAACQPRPPVYVDTWLTCGEPAGVRGGPPAVACRAVLAQRLV